MLKMMIDYYNLLRN